MRASSSRSVVVSDEKVVRYSRPWGFMVEKKGVYRKKLEEEKNMKEM